MIRPRSPAARPTLAALAALALTLGSPAARGLAPQDAPAATQAMTDDEPATTEPAADATDDDTLLVHRPPEEILRAGRIPQEPAPLPDRPAIHDSIAKGVEHLLAAQNEDGSFGSWNEPAHEFWSNPHTHFAWIAATTGLGVMTFLDLPESERVLKAADRAVAFLVEQSPLQRPSDWDVDNTWGYIYGLQALSVALQHPRYADTPRREDMIEKAGHYLEGLAQTQSPDGGWGYYDFETLAQRPSWSTSFMTAVGILAMLDAKAAGLPVEEERLARAVRALERCLLPTGAYTYSVNAFPRPGGLEWIDQTKGSLSRIQVGNLALVLAGSDKVDHDDLLKGLDEFFEHHRFLDVARKKPYPHEAYYANSGYFYFFGHYYAARILELLPVAEKVRYQARLAREVVKTQEADGSMWDFYINTYHKAYGTSFGVMTLLRTLPQEEPVAPPPRPGRR